MANYLVDTCILIDYFRGHTEAASFLDGLNAPPYLSSLKPKGDTHLSLETGVQFQTGIGFQFAPEYAGRRGF